MTDIVRDKAGLRGRLRHRRAAHVAAIAAWERGLAFAQPPTPLIAALADRTIVAVYAAHGSEPDIMRLAEALAASGHALALPRLLPEDGAMEFVAYHPGEPLTPDRHGIPAPAAHAALAAPDAILCPLLGFDRALGRIGQGGGYYDRAFAAHPDALRIGIAWSVQEVDAVPTEPHDVSLHAVLTEREWIAAS